MNLKIITKFSLLVFILLCSCKSDKSSDIESAESVENIQDAPTEDFSGKNVQQEIIDNNETENVPKKKEEFKAVEKKKVVKVKTSKCDKILEEKREVIRLLTENPENESAWDKIEEIEFSQAYKDCRVSSKTFMNSYDVLVKQLDNI
jgi:hypothetical protein